MMGNMHAAAVDHIFYEEKKYQVKERQVTKRVYASCHANPERNMLNFRDVLFFKVYISILTTDFSFLSFFLLIILLH